MAKTRIHKVKYQSMDRLYSIIEPSGGLATLRNMFAQQMPQKAGSHREHRLKKRIVRLFLRDRRQRAVAGANQSFPGSDKICSRTSASPIPAPIAVAHRARTARPDEAMIAHLPASCDDVITSSAGRVFRDASRVGRRGGRFIQLLAVHGAFF